MITSARLRRFFAAMSIAVVAALAVSSGGCGPTPSEEQAGKTAIKVGIGGGAAGVTCHQIGEC